MHANEYRLSFGGDENVFKIVVIVAQFCDYTKMNCTL